MNYFVQEPNALSFNLCAYLLSFTTLRVPSFVRNGQSDLLLMMSRVSERSRENGEIQ